MYSQVSLLNKTCRMKDTNMLVGIMDVLLSVPGMPDAKKAEQAKMKRKTIDIVLKSLRSELDAEKK